MSKSHNALKEGRVKKASGSEAWSYRKEGLSTWSEHGALGHTYRHFCNSKWKFKKWNTKRVSLSIQEGGERTISNLRDEHQTVRWQSRHPWDAWCVSGTTLLESVSGRRLGWKDKRSGRPHNVLGVLWGVSSPLRMSGDCHSMISIAVKKKITLPSTTCGGLFLFGLFLLITTYHTEEVRAETQVTAEAKTKRKAATGFCPMPCSVCLLLQSRAICLGVVPCTVGCAFSQQSLIKNIPHRLVNRPACWTQTPKWGSLLLGNSSLCQDGKK